MNFVYDLFVGQNIHYDMEDLLEQANEVQEMLGRSYAVPDELDEADLEAGERGDINLLEYPFFQRNNNRTRGVGSGGGGGRAVLPFRPE
jgi:hypothetical protein